MDRYEYKLKTEQIQKLIDKKDYEAALEIVETINWRKVRDIKILSSAAEVYIAVHRYDEALDLLEQAYEIAPIGKRTLYRMTEVAILAKDAEAAHAYLNEFIEIAPKDSGRYLLEYRLARLEKKPLRQRIEILESYQELEFEERWSFELARLYAEVGRTEECIKLCDEISLWFNQGKYVEKALTLKEKYAPLTEKQQEQLLRSRNARQKKKEQTEAGQIRKENAAEERRQEETAEIKEEEPVEISAEKEDGPKEEEDETSGEEKRSEKEISAEEISEEEISEEEIPEEGVPEEEIPEEKTENKAEDEILSETENLTEPISEESSPEEKDRESSDLSEDESEDEGEEENSIRRRFSGFFRLFAGGEGKEEKEDEEESVPETEDDTEWLDSPEMNAAEEESFDEPEEETKEETLSEKEIPEEEKEALSEKERPEETEDVPEEENVSEQEEEQPSGPEESPEEEIERLSKDPDIQSAIDTGDVFSAAIRPTKAEDTENGEEENNIPEGQLAIDFRRVEAVVKAKEEREKELGIWDDPFRELQVQEPKEEEQIRMIFSSKEEELHANAVNEMETPAETEEIILTAETEEAESTGEEPENAQEEPVTAQEEPVTEGSSSGEEPTEPVPFTGDRINEVILPDDEDEPEEICTESASEPALEPQAESVTKPESEPAAESVTEPETEPAAEPETQPAAKPQAEQEAEPITESAAEQEAEPITESAAEQEAEPAAEPVAEAERESLPEEKGISGEDSFMTEIVEPLRTEPSENGREVSAREQTEPAVAESSEKKISLLVSEDAKPWSSHNLIVRSLDYKAGTELAMGYLMRIPEEERMSSVAKTTGRKLNHKDWTELEKQLQDRILLISEAAGMDDDCLEYLRRYLTGENHMAVLIDSDENIYDIGRRNPYLLQMFDVSYAFYDYSSDEIVQHGLSYAEGRGWKLDDMAVLAYYAAIENMPADVPRGQELIEAEKIIDEAIDTATQKSLGRMIQKAFGTKKDAGNVLRESYFRKH